MDGYGRWDIFGYSYNRDYQTRPRKDRSGFWAVVWLVVLFAPIYSDLGLEGAISVVAGLTIALLILVVPILAIVIIARRFERYLQVCRVKQQWQTVLLDQISTR